MLSGFKTHVAAFDALDLFGIGHGRDIVIVRRSRARRQPSPSPSSASLEHGTPGGFLLSPVENIATTEHSNLPIQVVAPDSVCEPAFGPHDTSSAVPPDVSACSDATSVPTRIFLLKCYVESSERHEKIALSLPATACQGYETDSLCKMGNVLGLTPNALEGSPANSDAPLQRYLADLAQTHEEVAVALESLLHVDPPGPGLPSLNSCFPDSSISLSDDPDSTHEYQRQRALHRASLLTVRKNPRVRKRSNESQRVGHSDKVIKEA